MSDIHRGFSPELERKSQHPDDFIFGAGNIKRPTLQPDGQWDDYLPAFEPQRRMFESYSCVVFSALNCLETLHKRLYNYEINLSDRYIASLAVKPYVGASMKGVADTIRNQGDVTEDEWAYTDQMDYIEYLQTPPKEIFDKAKELLNDYEIGYEALPRHGDYWKTSYADPDVLKEALIHAPVQVAVDASYEYNSDGTIGKLLNYNHAVMLYGYKEGEYWKIYDQYENKFLKFEWSYKMGFPNLYSLTKRNMKLYKKKGSPAIYFKRYDKDTLIPFADGEITGGELFKSIYGVEYAKLPIERVDELPYPVENMEIKVINS